MPSRRGRGAPPEEVAGILQALSTILNRQDSTGQRVGNAKYGVYAFYDYDGEPIYVGQTTERLRVRIRRHLSNQRTDAVAMSVLDPFEVADVEMWPFWSLQDLPSKSLIVKSRLNSAEYTVFQNVLASSSFGVVLNEVPVKPAPTMELPESIKGRIVPPDVYSRRVHSDVRIARRASTIARLAQVISEREVQRGLRATLLTQARRLERLAKTRLAELGGPPLPGEGGESEKEDDGKRD